MPRKRTRKGVDNQEIELYGYTYEEHGPDYHVETETWSGTVPQKDKRIVGSLETAPGRGLVWTNANLKEET